MSTGAGERAWCVVVPHHASGARLARRRLAEELTEVVPATLLADLVAVLAELVGNAVRHADPLPGGVVRVAWRLRTSDEGQRITLRVTDGGATEGPRIRSADPDAADGRGLHIVSGLASRWGVDRDGLGQSVWAEFEPVGAARSDLVAAG
ncbi:Anti-sigma regulatory factor (Ser/Thr protein kinase) [Micromonospora echinaurantiaca]|uniref:Anti-sigma regulatory factor (Ser/Thr protein kinase) n=1 Tax=Micromonospora echinaurantiaca TaxID=47857 RepID=A0A1C5K8D0_9ACTN|nr:Anti-sigma regulatory factor (Ser/Thr protein kinase) [Micromonospora echinaurantiaca]